MTREEKRKLWNFWNEIKHSDKQQVVVDWIGKYSFDFVFEELVIKQQDKEKRQQELNKITEVHSVILEKQNQDLEIKNLGKRAWEVYQTTNWTQLPDARLSQEGRKLYRDYRNYLLDIEKLWRNKQLKDFKVMTFEEWRKDPPIYKLEKEEIL